LADGPRVIHIIALDDIAVEDAVKVLLVDSCPDRIRQPEHLGKRTLQPVLLKDIRYQRLPRRAELLVGFNLCSSQTKKLFETKGVQFPSQRPTAHFRRNLAGEQVCG